MIALRQLAAVAALTITASLPLLAGEPIQFSREKPGPTSRPDETGRLSREAARESKGLVPYNPIQGLAPGNPEIRARDPREERRRKTERNESKNWMFHERGESREREEDEMGIREYTLEKDDGTADSIFAPKANDSRNAGRPRPPSSLRRPASHEQDEAPPARPPEPAKDAKRADPEDQHRDPAGGDHVSKDLDLRALLNGVKSSHADSAEQAEAASRSTRPGDLSVRTRDDQERRRDTDVAGPGPGGTKSAGLGDAPGAGNTVAAPRATPSSFVPVAPGSAGLNTPLDRNFGGGPSLSRPGLDPGPGRSFNNPYSIYPPSLSTPYYDSRNPNPGYGTPSPFGQKPTQNSAPSQSTWDKSRIPRF